MKRTRKYILIISLFALLFGSSCNKDSSTPVTITRAGLTGTWLVTESSKKATYEVYIQTDSSSSTGVLITNFAGAGQNVKATAYLSNSSLVMTNELLSNGWIVIGNGVISSLTQINWPYTLHDGSNLINIQAIYTKK